MRNHLALLVINSAPNGMLGGDLPDQSPVAHLITFRDTKPVQFLPLLDEGLRSQRADEYGPAGLLAEVLPAPDRSFYWNLCSRADWDTAVADDRSLKTYVYTVTEPNPYQRQSWEVTIQHPDTTVTSLVTDLRMSLLEAYKLADPSRALVDLCNEFPYPPY